MMVGNGARGGSIIGVAETAGYKHASGRVINDTSTRRQGAKGANDTSDGGDKQ